MAGYRSDSSASKRRAVEIEVDGRKILACKGETVAAALMGEGTLVLRRTAKSNEPRGVFCGIGLCQECLMTIDGTPNVRACQTRVRPGMKVKVQKGLPGPERRG